MKPYATIKLVEGPDRYDVRVEGRQSAFGPQPKRVRHYRREMRRHLKRADRARVKAEVQAELNDVALPSETVH